MLKFEWDAEKAASNVRKHGVSLDEAGSVFLDQLDQHAVTFRSEAEALAFTRTLEARLCAPHQIPDQSQQRAAG